MSKLDPTDIVAELRAELAEARARADVAEKQLVRRGLRDLARAVDEPATSLLDAQALDVFVCGKPLFTMGAKPHELAQVKEILRSMCDPFLRRTAQELEDERLQVNFDAKTSDR